MAKASYYQLIGKAFHQSAPACFIMLGTLKGIADCINTFSGAVCRWHNEYRAMYCFATDNTREIVTRCCIKHDMFCASIV